MIRMLGKTMSEVYQITGDQKHEIRNISFDIYAESDVFKAWVKDGKSNDLFGVKENGVPYGPLPGKCRQNPSIKKIISGGQTGADQAALDIAMELNIPHGGMIPRGRRTEAGPLAGEYHLQEMATSSYPQRTEKNVLNSEGTLIISYGKLNGGSALTRQLAKKHKRPWLHLDMNKWLMADAVRITQKWISRHEVEILNVAGPRASKSPKIYETVKEILRGILTPQ